METVIVVFNRDLRVHDHPALAEACARARWVVPMFVVDPGIRAGARAGFLAEALEDLRGVLRDLGGDLVVREGDPVAEVMRVAEAVRAEAVWVSGDVTPYGRRRERRLAEACAGRRMGFRAFPGVTVVPAGELRPAFGDHYRVFTPYWRAWSAHRRREVLGAPREVRLPDGVPAGEVRGLRRSGYGNLRGGETVGRRRLELWLKLCLADYDEGHDDLSEDRTSMLSPYLHFGCVSPGEVVAQAEGRPGAEGFVRQVCWRDFHHQVAFAFPELARRDYRARDVEWVDDPEAVEAWKEGMTGIPVVDAGMRQLRTEGWMHNRARLIVGSYLTKRLRVHWQVGGRHFMDLLLDADFANNWGNWQWVAGTGNDTRPNRVLNPVRQARKLDPDGEYVRRYVPELAGVPASLIHEPWKASPPIPRYPAPLGPATIGA
ncbi:deoxyribodipyrimidine photo-lyase [Sphaerisporangium sp. B11E5]|uniref:cryptochrome/photolyase family protein n=1 Tax=Sphaerisporangium sp. B11E5 TaxID=3153563 RepID=UPI00325D2068